MIKSNSVHHLLMEVYREDILKSPHLQNGFRIDCTSRTKWLFWMLWGVGEPFEPFRAWSTFFFAALGQLRWAVRVMVLARFSRNLAQIHKDRLISP